MTGPLRVGVHYGFPFTKGGVERHLLSLVDHASELEWVFIGAADDNFSRELTQRGIRLLPSNGPRSRRDHTHSDRLASLLESERADVAHAHSPRGLAHMVRAAAAAGVPVVQTVHLPVDDLVAGRGITRRIHAMAHEIVHRRLIAPHLAHTIFVSRTGFAHAHQRRLVSSRRSSVIPNGIDLDVFARADGRYQVRTALGANPEVPVLIAVGRLERQKGLDVLIEALAAVREAVPEIELWLVGDGPDGGMLRNLATQLGVHGHCRFLGSRDDVPALFQASDVFVLPSRFEALPYALLEALAAGLPCVVSDVGDCGVIVSEGGCGAVVPPARPGPLAEALGDLVRDAKRRWEAGAAARRTAHGFTVTEMAARTAAVLAAAAGRPAP